MCSRLHQATDRKYLSRKFRQGNRYASISHGQTIRDCRMFGYLKISGFALRGDAKIRRKADFNLRYSSSHVRCSRKVQSCATREIILRFDSRNQARTRDQEVNYDTRSSVCFLSGIRRKPGPWCPHYENGSLFVLSIGIVLFGAVSHTVHAQNRVTIEDIRAAWEKRSKQIRSAPLRGRRKGRIA